MLYLLGGSPRVGKTTTSKLFLTETGIPYLGLDYLKMGIARGWPDCGVDPNDGDLVIAEQLWPVVKGMALTLYERDEDYMLEGTYLLPEYVADLQEMIGGSIRACFVGCAEVDTWEKVLQIRNYGKLNGEMDWSSDNDEEAILQVEFLKEFSAYMKDECEKYGLKYFESSSDHAKTIENIVRYLKR